MRLTSVTMPALATCPNCRLPYYQTSAVHVCSEYRKEETVSHQRNVSGNCVISGCPCRGWSQQQPAVTTTKHEPAARGEGETRLVVQGRCIHDSRGNFVAEVDGCLNNESQLPQLRADIVDRYNSHTALVEQRNQLLAIIRQLVIDEQDPTAFFMRYDKVLPQARAVLNEAERR